ncbi:MAG TPA: 16S rRNA (guanine(966)-N(2))-methyltransferase RsmD [Clostridiaceae bacterium]|nr:16S rRNA (guanine(966)-N(2))-methyltransferase RsmD [Clostridiaceae bacterium]
MPRIITGTARGIHLVTNQHELMRPTTDRFKEAVFSGLQGKMESGRLNSFLDLFAGCGQIGLEAKSRGVENVVLVEQNKQAINTINKNIAKTGLTVKLLPFNVKRALRQLSNEVRQFDIIYLDPPWPEMQDYWREEEFKLYDLLEDDGLVMIEHAKKIAPIINPQLWSVVKHKNYGQNTLLVLEQKGV